MSETFDPVESLYSGFRAAFVSFGGFLVVSLCGHVLGQQVHTLSHALAAVPSGGFAALNAALNWDLTAFFWSWVTVFVGSVVNLLAIPFILLDVWLLARLRSGEETFSTLFVLALTQPIHTFIVIERGSASTWGELVLGVTLLAGSLISLALLLLWWKSVHDEQRRAEAEGELEL